jgi:hypothetical protein
MHEFKADSAVLLFGGVIVWLIERCETDKSRINIKYLLLMFVTAFAMDVTKQQALYIDFALGIYLVFTKKFNVAEKVKILASLVLAGIVDLIVIFSIPGLEITAIKNLKAMPYHDLSRIIADTNVTILRNMVCVVVLVAMLVIWILKKVKLSSLANKWLLVSLLFLAGQTVGEWKEGGNYGNYEVGLVCFLPFAVLSVHYFFTNYILKEKQRDVAMLCSLVLAVVMLYMACSIPCKRASEVADKINSDTAVSEYLSKAADGKTVMYHSNQYMQIAKSTALPGLDLMTIPSYLDEYDDVVKDNIKNQTNDFIYAKKSHFDSDTLKLIEENYILVEDSDMPDSLQNKLWIAKRLK